MDAERKRLFVNMQCVLMSFRRKKEMALLCAGPNYYQSSKLDALIYRTNLEY